MTTEAKAQAPAAPAAPPKHPRFELNMQPIKITALRLPTKKHREGLIRTVDISFTMEGGNQLLNLFDPVLLDQHYKAVETSADQMRHKQIQIEELDEGAPKPLLRCQNIAYPVRLSLEYVGYTLTIDRGMGDHVSVGKNVTSNIVVPETTVKGISIECKEGGSVIVRGRLQATNMEDEDIGRLSHFIKRETRISAKAPEVKQAAIDGTTAAFKKDHPGAQPDDNVVDAELESGETRGTPKPRGNSRAVPPAKKGGGAKGGKDNARAATDAFVAAQKGGAQPGASAH